MPGPGVELRVAAAGPLVTVGVIALSLLAGALLAAHHHFFAVAVAQSGVHTTPAVILLSWVATLNMLVLIVNLIPAFPLDGGQIAHALIWWRTGDRYLATRVTGRLGQGFAMLIGAGGLVLLVALHDEIGLWLAFIALFVYQGASAAVVQGSLGKRIQGLRVADVMDPEPVTIPAATGLLDAQEQFFLRYRWPWFAVVDPTQHFLGVVRSARVDDEIAAGRPALEVSEVLEENLPIRIDEHQPLESVLRSEGLGRLGAMVAVDDDGVLRGVVTVAQIRQALRPVVGRSEHIESRFMPSHDVLIIGAGLAGQRAALAAAETGASVAIMSKVHPVRSHSVAAAGGINAAISVDDDWRSHAYDTVKGSDFLGDQDAIEIMCSEAPQEVMHLEHIGVTFHRNDERPARPARVRRSLDEAHRLRRRHHRPGDPARALRAADEAPRNRRPLRGVVHDLAAAGRPRALLRSRRARRALGAHGGLPRQERDPRLRRRRAGLQPDDQRADRDRRRDRAGLPHRGAADGHGDGPVPPDDARRERPADHRGRTRRGRRAAQLRGRALHGEVRAQQDGARLARRRLARRADRDPRGPRRRAGRQRHLPRHHEGPAQAHARGAARDRQHRQGLRRRGHHARADHDPPRPALHHGRRQDRRQRRDPDRGAVRGGRGRLRLGPRRQPARRELAAGHADLRAPRRRARGGALGDDGDAQSLRRKAARGRRRRSTRSSRARGMGAPPAPGASRRSRTSWATR